MPSPDHQIGATFDIHVITSTGGGHLLTIHQDARDEGPLQLISTQRLSRLEQVEAMMERLLGESLDDVCKT